MDTQKAFEDAKDPDQEAGGSRDESSGSRPVGLFGTIILCSYLLAFTVFLGYSLACFWIVAPTETGQSEPTFPQQIKLSVAADSVATRSPVRSAKVTVNYLTFQPYQLSHEALLLAIAALCGALGAMVHTLRSLSWYIGHRQLKHSWTAKYVMQPFVGAGLALLFYFVARAGFLSAQAGAESSNILGFAAMSGLVGLFSDQAVLKLKEVAETLLTKPKAGADPAPPQDDGSDGRAAASDRPKDEPPAPASDEASDKNKQ